MTRDKIRELWDALEADKPPSQRRRFDDVADELFLADFAHLTKRGWGEPMSYAAAFHVAESNAKERRAAKEEAAPRPAAVSTLRGLGFQMRAPLDDDTVARMAKDCVSRFGTVWLSESQFAEQWRRELTGAAGDWNSALESHSVGATVAKLYSSLIARFMVNKFAAGAEVAALERRVAALEQRGAVNLADADKGVWKDGPYPRGSCVTFGGSYWLAKQDTTSKPGTDSTWRLVAKRGADGKDKGRST